jgi:hypothetical protein
MMCLVGILVGLFSGPGHEPNQSKDRSIRVLRHAGQVGRVFRR